jgi:hypothetical protein
MDELGQGRAYKPGGAAYAAATYPDGPTDPDRTTGPGGTTGAAGAYGPGGAAYAAAGYRGGPPGDGDGGGGAGGTGRKRPVRTAVVAVVAAAAVAVAGGVALAATRNGSGTSAQSGPGAAGRPAGAGGGGPGGLAGSIAHGEVVVADSSGGYVTRLLQTGTVTAVSSTSITVRSADNYAVTYTVASGTTVDSGTDAIGAVATGHTVTILASTAKAAVTITDQNLASAAGGIPGQNGTAGGQAEAGTGTS